MRKLLACLLVAAIASPSQARVVASVKAVSAPVSVSAGAAAAHPLAGGSALAPSGFLAGFALPYAGTPSPAASAGPSVEMVSPAAVAAAVSGEGRPGSGNSRVSRPQPEDGGERDGPAVAAEQAEASRGRFLYAGLRFEKDGVYASLFDGARSFSSRAVPEAPKRGGGGARSFSDRASMRGSAASGRRWKAASRAVPEDDFLSVGPGENAQEVVLAWLKRRAAERGAKIVGAAVQGPGADLKLASRLWRSQDIVPMRLSSRIKDPARAARLLARRAARGFTVEDGVPVPVVRVKPSGEVEVSELGTLEDYRRTVPREDFKRVREEAEAFRGKRLVFFSSTPRGGGVALMRHALIRFYRLLGVDARWYVMDPDEAVFATTKRLFHNVLQGVSRPDERLGAADKRRFEAWSAKNAAKFARVFRGADVIVIDDYQPSGMIPFIRGANPRAKILYRSHIHIRSELISRRDGPQREVWDYLWKNIRLADKFVSHPVPEFVPAGVPEEMVAFAPAATDPLDGLNKRLTREQSRGYLDQVDRVLRRLGQSALNRERGYIVQVARFDPSKGIPTLLEAYRLLRERLRREGTPDAAAPQLLLAGHGAVDDVQGGEIYRATLEVVRRDYPDLAQDIKLAPLPPGDQLLNAVLRGALFATQLSSAEGFEVKVSEAQRMGKAVLGTRVGGIPLQIDDGRTGYLVRPADAARAAERMRALLSEEGLRRRMGEAARRARRKVTTVDNALRWLRLARGAEPGTPGTSTRNRPRK